MRNHAYSSTGQLVIALAAAAAFGGFDRYLGARYSPFLAAVSAMSAPWLLLPFLVGACQPSPRRAAVLGLAATWVALGAYVLRIASPAGVHLSTIAVVGASQRVWFVAGLISGPLFGALGYHWRAARSWAAALLAALPAVLEPAARWLGHHAGLLPGSRSRPAEYAEAVAGLALTLALAAAMPGPAEPDGRT